MPRGRVVRGTVALPFPPGLPAPGEPLPRAEDTQAALWTVPCGWEQRPPANSRHQLPVREGISWKRVPSPVKPSGETAAPASRDPEPEPCRLTPDS